MTGPLYAIGRFCSRHHYPTIAVWLVLAVGLVVAGQAAEGKTNDNLTLPGTGSTEATELLEEQPAPSRPTATTRWSIVSTGERLTTPRYSEAIAETVKRLNAKADVNSAVDPLSPQGTDVPQPRQAHRLHPRLPRHRPRGTDRKPRRRAVLDAAAPVEAVGLEASIGGYVGQQLSKPSTEISEAIGLTAAVIILLFAFGTATAMMLPIVSAVIGLACALSIIRLLEGVIQVPSVAATLATMIGLGVGIDYALFIVTRHKLQLRDGMEMHESIARATATAGGAVVFAGFTVVIALCSLGFAGIPLVTTLGFTAAIAVLTAVVAAATLLPAVLGLLGPRIDSLRVKLGKTHPDDRKPHGWLRWADGRRHAAVALDRRLAGGPDRPRDPAARPRTRPERHQRLPQVDDRAPVGRRPARRLRPGLDRAAADRLRIQLGRGRQAGRPRSCRRRSTKRRNVAARLAADLRPAGHRRGLLGDLRIGALGRRNGRTGRRPARDDDPGGPEGERSVAPTSAARPPATSTSPPRSATSCR